MFAIGVIVSLCYVPGITGAYIATQWPVLAIVLWFGLLRSGPLTVFHWLGILFLGYATAATWWTPTPYASVFGLWLVWIMGLCLWFGTTLTDVRGLYAGLAMGGAVSSVLAVAQAAGLNPIPTITATPAGLYVNSVQQGTVLALFVVALVSERMWLWVLPMLPGIILSGSRGALLTLAIGLLACYVRRLWVFGVLAIAGAIYLYMSPASSDLERLEIWSVAWQSLKPYGWGPGVFYTIWFPHGSVPFYPEYAHNDALQLLFEYGAGALPVFAIFAFALSRTRDSAWPVVLAFVTAGCFSMPLYMPLTSFLGLIAVGRGLRAYGLSRSNSHYSRQHVVSRERGYCTPGWGFVSVASHHSTEG